MSNPVVQLGLLALAGVAAGYINVIAGAGSLLTLPALIFTGLDAGVANATNRVAIAFQNTAAVVAFRRGGHQVLGPGLVLAVPAVIAGVAGAFVAAHTPDSILRLCIAGAMVVFLVLAVIPRPAPKTIAGATGPGDAVKSIDLKAIVAFTAIGFYAGFLQAGVGILVLLYMSLVQRMDLVSANGLKVVVILLLTLFALATFIWQGVRIDLLRGLVLAAATTTGGYLGAVATMKRGDKFVRVVLVVAVLASVVKLAWSAV